MVEYLLRSSTIVIIYSTELSKFLTTLDARYQEKTKKEGILVARKNRKDGSPSKALPRPGAPEWTEG